MELGGRTMGVSDPEIRKKLFGPRWQHEIEKQGWPLWKRLIYRLQRRPLCRPKGQNSRSQKSMREIAGYATHRLI